MRKINSRTKAVFAGVLAVFVMLLFVMCTAATSDENELQENKQIQTEEKRKELLSEATSAIRETENALRALDDDDSEYAIESLERASGKLSIILARAPEFALAPSSVEVVTYDILADIDAIEKLRQEAEEALKKGQLQKARRLIKNLASETVISLTNIPLATYPNAIKQAVKLIDEDKLDEAKGVLQTALNTLVVTETIIPLPVSEAERLLKEAEKLAEEPDRTREENDKLARLLQEGRTELEFAQALGYGSKDDFENIYSQLGEIEDKTKDGKSGAGLFSEIEEGMHDAVMSSQPESNKQEIVSSKR